MKKTSEFLDEFYKNRKVPENIKLTMERIGLYGAFRVHNGGEDYGLIKEKFKNLTDKQKKELSQRLEKYREEMKKFTEFLKEKYFERETSEETENKEEELKKIRKETEEAFQEKPEDIETLKGPEGSEISFYPKRGGIITSIKLKGKEILRKDPNDFKDPNYKVRGGIPIMFPNAGSLREGGPYLLKQHGFARNSEWKIDRNVEKEELVEKLEATEDTKKVFPYDFLLKIKTKVEKDGSISLIQEATNKEKDKKMPIAMGLHPYFQVPEEKKKEVLSGLIGKEKADKKFDEWQKGNTVIINNPEDLKLSVPGLGRIKMKASKEYEKIWIWTQPDQNFICVEPVMRDVEGLVEDPELIEPGESFSGKVNFSLEEPLFERIKVEALKGSEGLNKKKREEK